MATHVEIVWYTLLCHAISRIFDFFTDSQMYIFALYANTTMIDISYRLLFIPFCLFSKNNDYLLSTIFQLSSCTKKL